MSTPDLHIRTCFVLTEEGRSSGTGNQVPLVAHYSHLSKVRRPARGLCERMFRRPLRRNSMNLLKTNHRLSILDKLRFIHVVISLFLKGEFRQTNGPKGRPLSQM